MVCKHSSNLPLCVPCICGKIPSEKNYKKLLRKFRAPRRIRLLAQPKMVTPKFEGDTFEPPKFNIKIVGDETTPFRLKQLAVPPVRKLVATRNDCINFKEPGYIDRFDEMIKRSFFTIYSRLANVEVPQRSDKPPKWTESEWKAHNEWLSRRAKHKWPFDFKLPKGFSEPITRVKLRALAKEISMRPWIKRYQQELARQTEKYRRRIKPDPFLMPFKRSKKAAEFSPFSPYFEQYSELLRAISAKAKEERLRRKGELNPEPRPQQQEHAKDIAGKWPEKVVKLSARPAWKAEQEAAELQWRKQQEEIYKKVTDNKKIKQKPRLRTLRLALLTDEQKEEVEMVLKERKKEQDELQNCFKPKEVKELPEKRMKRFKELAQAPEYRAREKVKLEKDEVPFVKYW